MKILFTLAIWLLSVANTLANSSWTNRFISYKDGLPATQVNDILQDSQGYIWLGSNMELSRFDGSHLVNFEWLGNGDRRMPANVGNLYLDEKHQLLWIRTHKYVYHCYDLRTKKFINYGTPEQQREGFRRYIITDDGIWLCDTHCIRHITYSNGQLTCTDYSAALGNLPDGDAERIRKDARGNIWAIVGGGLVFFTPPDGKMTPKVKNASINRMTMWKDRILAFSKTGKLYTYNSLGKLARTDQMPKGLCKLGTDNSGFVWNNKWILTTSSGICAYDILRHTFTMDKSLSMAAPRFLDHEKGVNFVGDKGTMCVFAEGKPMLRLPLMEGMNITAQRKRHYSSTVGEDGRYYIATFGNGLFIYDPKNGNMEHHTANDPVPLITTDFLTDIKLDRQGNIWLAQEEAGVVCIGRNNGLHTDVYMPIPGAKGGWRNNVCFLGPCDKAGNLLVATRDNQYYNFSAKTGQFQLRGAFNAAVFSYIKDHKGREWFGTRGDGLYIDGQHYSPTDADHHIPTGIIESLAVDGKGRVWAATTNIGLLALTLTDDGKLHCKQYLSSELETSKTSRLALDKKGILWIACDAGLITLDTKIANVTDKSFVIRKSPKNQQPFNEISIPYCAANGNVWAALFGHGVLRLQQDANGYITDQELFDKRSGLHGNHISSITEDRSGNVWIGTSSHISLIDRRNGRIQSYEMPPELDRAYFSRGMARRLNDGRLLYATSEGLMAFAPDKIKNRPQSPHTASLTDIIVNGISINMEEELQDCLEDGEYVFPYDHNNLKLAFSNFDFSHKSSTLYQYWLEGRDKTWSEPTSETTISYDKLSPGTYVFHIRTLGNNDEASIESSQVIVIKQPWWNTWWAWTIYLIIIGTTAWLFYRNWKRRFDLQQEIKLQEQVTNIRLEFFTHVTHEFRTPLAIISGAVDKMSDKTPETVSKKTIQTVKRGAARLRQLVDRLMEFRKISTGNISLQVEQGDLVAFIKDLMQDFLTLAQQKQQSLTFTPCAKQYITYFDRHIVDTIVYNLISNAVKYTPDRGTIEVRLKQDDNNRLLIIVEDNGPGISPERQKDMYSPFMHGHASAGGMGIGLYTAMQMATTHKGALEYENTGHGSCFTLAIPSNDSLYEAADYSTAKALDTDDTTEMRRAEEIIRELLPNPMNDIRIAVIEDEPDMLEQLHNELSNYFIVDTYATGNGGLTGIMEHKPSLVVCDVMLPDTNGYDIVRKLKTNAETAQTPVILLTALDDADHQIKGYKAGADDYMVKPCNSAVLVARIAQLIQWSKPAPAAAPVQPTDNTSATVAPANSASTSANTEALAKPAEAQVITSQLDRAFIDRLEKIMEQNACNPNISVDDIAEMMHMGRTKFYGRCRDLIGMSPNKYLLQTRLERSAKMLLTGENTVAEVCYAVGFNDPSHFNKCFKAQYGVPPSKYGK